MKHDPMTTANAVAATTAIIYVICRLLVGLFPAASFTVAQSWFHGIQLTQLGTWNLTFSNLLLGVISSTVLAWLVGYLFAYLYNYFLKAK